MSKISPMVAFVSLTFLLGCTKEYQLRIAYQGEQPVFKVMNRDIFGRERELRSCITSLRVVDQETRNEVWQLSVQNYSRCIPNPISYGENPPQTSVVVRAQPLLPGRSYHATMSISGGIAGSGFTHRPYSDRVSR